MKLLKIRQVKSPQRDSTNAGIDFFIPSPTTEFIMDLKSKNPNTFINSEKIEIVPNSSVLIPSGIKSLFDKNIALVANNKSGVATKKQLIVGAQVVDSSYRGEIHLHVINTSNKIVSIEYDTKLVQFVPYLIDTHNIEVAENISEEEFYGEELKTERGAGGFGSTGLK